MLRTQLPHLSYPTASLSQPLCAADAPTEPAFLLRKAERGQSSRERKSCAADSLIGNSAAMQALRQQIRRLGPTRLPVLILGESGTGKELVARALHDASDRPGDLIAVNCGALPRDLIESELFGHERGAFSGAQQRHLGCFGEADGGTLFLDEIAEMPLELQPRLLRALENQAIRPVGATRERQVDVRILAATHCDLEQAVRRGRFRADLYFRLCALDLVIPPLRERPEDIAPLVRHFLAEAGDKRPLCRIADSELARLAEHAWPGNVRQLRNAVLRAIHLAGPELVAEDLVGVSSDGRLRGFLSSSAIWPVELALAGRSFAELERQIYLQALEQTGGSCRAAAELLKVPKSTLYDKLRRLGISSGRGFREENSGTGA